MAKRFNEETTVLSQLDEKFDAKNLVFSDPISNEIMNGTQKIKNYRIYIGTKNPDGTTGNLMVATHKLFSFGASENKNDQGKLSGYTLPISLWNSSEPDNVKQPKQLWLEKFKEVCNQVAEHLVRKDVKKKINKIDLEKGDLRKLGNIYYKKDKETQDFLMDEGPTLYLKVKFFAANEKTKRPAKVNTMFFHERTGEPMNIAELMGKRMNVRCVVDIESVYIGSKISIQCKLHEVEVEPVEQSQRRFLSHKASMLSGISTSNSHNPMAKSRSPSVGNPEEKEEEEEDVSIEPPKTVSPIVVKKSKKKKTVVE